MDTATLVQHLRESSLEEGRAYIIEHSEELTDHHTIGNALADEALAKLYSPFLSLKLAEVLTFFGEHDHHLPSHALGLKAKGDALVQIRLYQAALDSLDESAQEFLSLNDEENWARTRISWIVGATSLGRVEEALGEAAKARDVFQRLEQPYWVCVIDHNTAWVYRQVGRYQEAHTIYERIFTIYPTIQDRSDVFIERSIAMAKHSMAVNLSYLGRFEQAHYFQQQALASFNALFETNLAVGAESNLASFEYSQGYYGSALQRHYHAQALLAQHHINDPKREVALKLEIAHTLIKLNRTNEAKEVAYEAIEIYRQLDTSLETMNALREYATALVASGSLKEALAVLEEADVLFTQGGLEHYTLATRLQRAEVYILMNAFTEAYREAEALKPLFDTRGLIARSVRSALIMVEALLGQAEQEQDIERHTLFLRQAAAFGKPAALQARQCHLQEEVYRSQALLGRLFALQKERTKALRCYRVAIVQIEDMLDDLLYDLSPSFLQTSWAVYAETIDLYLQQDQNERAFHYLERARSMALRQYLNRSRTAPTEREEREENSPTPKVLLEKNALILRTQDELRDWQERYRKQSKLLAEIDLSVSPLLDQETLQVELKRCEAKINELFERLYLQQATRELVPRGDKRTQHETHMLDITQLQQHLAPDQLLLAYFLHKERLVIFAANTERLITCEIPDGMQQIKRLLPLLHAHLQPSGWADPQHPPQQAVRQMLRKLYALLIAPVAEYLPASPGQLIIVPYGPLHTLPFHALYDGTHFLVEQFQMSYLSASNLLTQVEASAASAISSISVQHPLVFGYSGQGHLQHALEEAKLLTNILDARCYLEEEATIARLSEQAPGSPIIHLATHGYSRLDAPNFSAVSLADGRFNTIDAFNLDLRGCELVTLSGCETGLALSGGGDEQLGLGRAFLASGAHTLVMSLWPVEDSATSELMQRFYQNLLLGYSKVQALCEAQRVLIQGMNTAHTHPYYWAAFRLVGETGPLRYIKQDRPVSP